MSDSVGLILESARLALQDQVPRSEHWQARSDVEARCGPASATAWDYLFLFISAGALKGPESSRITAIASDRRYERQEAAGDLASLLCQVAALLCQVAADGWELMEYRSTLGFDRRLPCYTLDGVFMRPRSEGAPALGETVMSL